MLSFVPFFFKPSNHPCNATQCFAMSCKALSRLLGLKGLLEKKALPRNGKGRKHRKYFVPFSRTVKAIYVFNALLFSLTTTGRYVSYYFAKVVPTFASLTNIAII